MFKFHESFGNSYELQVTMGTCWFCIGNFRLVWIQLFFKDIQLQFSWNVDKKRKNLGTTIYWKTIQKASLQSKCISFHFFVIHLNNVEIVNCRFKMLNRLLILLVPLNSHMFLSNSKKFRKNVKECRKLKRKINVCYKNSAKLCRQIAWKITGKNHIQG